MIFCHHPFFVSDIEEEDGHVAISKDKRKKYFDLFADNGVSAVYAGHLHHSAEGEYKRVKMATTTSVAYQLGERVFQADRKILFLYEIARPAKGLGYKIAVPATGEEVYFEIYGVDSKGIQYLMLQREL